jgi:hypothetical protein
MVRDDFGPSRREIVAKLLARGVARGEIAKDVDIDLVTEIVAGASWYCASTPSDWRNASCPEQFVGPPQSTKPVSSRGSGRDIVPLIRSPGGASRRLPGKPPIWLSLKPSRSP